VALTAAREIYVRAPRPPDHIEHRLIRMDERARMVRVLAGKSAAPNIKREYERIAQDETFAARSRKGR
jgi:hypothetical protein